MNNIAKVICIFDALATTSRAQVFTPSTLNDDVYVETKYNYPLIVQKRVFICNAAWQKNYSCDEVILRNVSGNSTYVPNQWSSFVESQPKLMKNQFLQ